MRNPLPPLVESGRRSRTEGNYGTFILEDQPTKLLFLVMTHGPALDGTEMGQASSSSGGGTVPIPPQETAGREPGMVLPSQEALGQTPIPAWFGIDCDWLTVSVRIAPDRPP